MDIRKAWENHLKLYPALAAIHNGQVVGGVAPATWKAPYQRFWVISDPSSGRKIGCPFPRIQTDNFAPTYSQAVQMAELTIQSIEDFRGTMGGSGGKVVVNAEYQDMSEDYEPDTGLYNCPVDVKIRYRE